MALQPAFHVEKVTAPEGKPFLRPITKIVSKTFRRGHEGEKEVVINSFEHSMQEYTEGYNIWYLQGHMLHLAADDTEALARHGVFDEAPLVDPESGETAPAGEDMNAYKQKTLRKLNNGKARMTGGLSTVGED